MSSPAKPTLARDRETGSLRRDGWSGRTWGGPGERGPWGEGTGVGAERNEKMEPVREMKRRTSGEPDRALRGRAAGPKNGYYLVHVTSVGKAREIIKAGQIETQTCRRFEENLVYFFALRPAYRLSGSDKKQSIIYFFPVVMLVDTEVMGVPFHVYPFDTGGALDGAFDEEGSEDVFLEDYELESTLQAASDHIHWAFDTRADYFDGKLKEGLVDDLPHWDVVPRTFANIAGLASVGSNRPDRRASAVELAFDGHVPMDRVALMILPKQFLEDPRGNNTEVMEGLEAANVEWRVYEWQPNRTPGDFYTEINAMVREYLDERGTL